MPKFRAIYIEITVQKTVDRLSCVLHEGVTLIGEIDEKNSSDELDEEFGEEEAASTIVMSDDSVEINVDELVEKLESSGDIASENKRAVRQRLDELRERQETQKELDSTYNFNLDDDL